MIGIIADTHDNLDAIKKAVDYFNRIEIGLLLHAGDYVSPFTADIFKKLNAPMKGVYGNNDGDLPALARKYEGIAEISSGWLKIKREGRRIILTHLPLPEPPSGCDLYIYGHTHQSSIENSGSCITLNPGDCSGWVSGRATVATVDLEKRKAEIIEI